MLNRPGMVALCIALGSSTAAYAGPCDNPHDRNPANNNNPTPACAALLDDALAAFGRWKAKNDAEAKAALDWQAAQEICRNLPSGADDPRAPLCQQVRERTAAIAKAQDDAQKAADTAILRRALAETPAPQESHHRTP